MNNKVMIKKILVFIFPPLALHSAFDQIPEMPEDFLESLLEDLRPLSDEDIKNSYDWTKFVYESEIKRKDVLESKAQSYVIGISIATSILSFIPVFLERWGLGLYINKALVFVFTVAIFYFLIAGHYAFKTRMSSPLAMPNVENFKQRLKDHEFSVQGNTAVLAYCSKYNEKSFIQKANFLYVSEACFMRAIFLILLSFISIGLTKVLL